MKEIKFNKKETNSELIIEVSLPSRKWASDPVINFSNSEMIEYMEQQNLDTSKYNLQEAPALGLTSYSDKKNNPRLTGIWTFKKSEPKVTKTTKPQKRVNKRKAQAYNKGEDTTGG